MQHIAIITVVYNNYDNLKDFFTSLDAQSDKGFHVYISDLSTKRKDIKLPDYATLLTGKNEGYAFGLNLGLEAASSNGFEKFVFINDDVILDKDFIKNAKRSIRKHPETLIGGKIYYAKGYEFHKNLYGKKDLGHVLWYAGGIMDWAHAYAKHRGVDEVDKGQYDSPGKTEFITGCLMAFDKGLIEKAGTMDDAYFLYYEDTDWNQQIIQKGGSLWYDPRLVIWHKNSQSTGGSGSAMHRRYQRKNIVKFGLRYAPLRTKFHLVKNFLLGR